MQRKIYFRENCLIILWILGEAELILGILVAKANTIKEPRNLFFKGFREIDSLFFVSKGA